jgi:hypothetical protein
MREGIRCVFLTPTARVSVILRRYASPSKCKQSGMGCHDASVTIGEADDDGSRALERQHAHDDPRWPAQCPCGYRFTETDARQCRHEDLFRLGDTDDLVTLRDAPTGAMWFAPWMSDIDEWRGPDGQTLVVRCPGKHDWVVDARASNCDSPCANCGVAYSAHKQFGAYCSAAERDRAAASGDVTAGEYRRYRDARPHKCWIRHGTPPKIHVDKAGVTCGAGAGSIAYPGWHGFLRKGRLIAC